MDFWECTSLLKKSLSPRSAVLKKPETRLKHYENSVFSPSTGGQKRVRRSFSTRWHLLGTSVNKGKRKGQSKSASARS